MPEANPAMNEVILSAEPEPLRLELKTLALIIIDMQNAFVSKGGMFDLSGEDISQGEKIIEPIKKISAAARAAGVRIIYVVHHLSPDLHETGGPHSGYWYTAHVRKYREDPAWRDKFIISGSWGAEIVRALHPHKGEAVVVKPRYSAFFGTNLDAILKGNNIKYLAFAGIATNICVEAAIRDASYLDYFPILVSDATAAAGPPFTFESALANVKLCFGWVTTVDNLIQILQR